MTRPQLRNTRPVAQLDALGSIFVLRLRILCLVLKQDGLPDFYRFPQETSETMPQGCEG